jgi:predicted CXXCH cytochrome family protein
LPVKLQFKDAEHLLRLAAIFIAGLLVFVVVRAALVPDDFGVYGHYRAGAVDDNRARPLVHAGQAACADCHGDVVTTRAAAGHVRVACEGCHGPLARHAAAPDEAKPVRPDGRELCARCHAANTGKPAWYRTVAVKDHAGEERCVACHTPHDPRIR